MLLFDTATLDERDRADAVSASMIDATLSTDLVHHDPADVWLRITSVDVGVVDLTRVAASGMDTHAYVAAGGRRRGAHRRPEPRCRPARGDRAGRRGDPRAF